MIKMFSKEGKEVNVHIDQIPSLKKAGFTMEQVVPDVEVTGGDGQKPEAPVKPEKPSK